MLEATLDSVALEAEGHLTDWLETGPEEGTNTRIRLTFIPSGLWASILARQRTCIKHRKIITDRIDSEESEDIGKDLNLLGKFEEQMLLIACEVVGRSLRVVEGRTALRLEGEALNELEVESLIADGLFWPCYDIIMSSHWSSPDAIRAIFRRGMV